MAIKIDRDDAPTKVSDSKFLKRISDAVVKAQHVAQRIAYAEDALKELKGEYHQITRQLLPDIFAEGGMSSITTAEGHKVEIKPMMSCSLTEERREDGLSWLRQNGYDDVIKSFVSVDFKKGEDKKREKLVTTLTAKGYSFESKESVHGGTLKSFLSSLIADGVAVPSETFGVYEYQEAKIKFASAELKTLHKKK